MAGGSGPSVYYVDWGIFPGPDYSSGFPLDAPSGIPEGAVCGDLDGDGTSELCTADGVYFSPLIEAATPGFSWIASEPHITSTDLDGDGIQELFVSDATTSAIYQIAVSSPDGEVILADIAAETWTSSAGQSTALAVGDLDGDGTDELIAGWTGNGDDATFVGLVPGGGDVASARTRLPVRADALAVGDFDGDGQDDLAVGGASEVTLWLGPLPEGRVDISMAAARYRGPQHPYDLMGAALAAADTDGDGRSELAIGAPIDNSPDEACDDSSCYAKGRVWWLLGGGL